MQYRLPGSHHGNRDRDLRISPIHSPSDLPEEFARVVGHSSNIFWLHGLIMNGRILWLRVLIMDGHILWLRGLIESSPIILWIHGLIGLPLGCTYVRKLAESLMKSKTKRRKGSM